MSPQEEARRIANEINQRAGRVVSHPHIIPDPAEIQDPAAARLRQIQEQERVEQGVAPPNQIPRYQGRR